MREDVKAYELKDGVVAYGDNKLFIPVPDTDPDIDIDVHVISCAIVDPVDTVKFPLVNDKKNLMQIFHLSLLILDRYYRLV